MTLRTSVELKDVHVDVALRWNSDMYTDSILGFALGGHWIAVGFGGMFAGRSATQRRDWWLHDSSLSAPELIGDDDAVRLHLERLLQDGGGSSVLLVEEAAAGDEGAKG